MWLVLSWVLTDRDDSMKGSPFNNSLLGVLGATYYLYGKYPVVLMMVKKRYHGIILSRSFRFYIDHPSNSLNCGRISLFFSDLNFHGPCIVLSSR